MSGHFGFPIESIILFSLIIIFALFIDLRSHGGKYHITPKSALLWSGFWIGLALGWYVYIHIAFQKEWADLFLVGYILEKSLSVDNLLVFIAVFNSFGARGAAQHRILYLGVIGAFLLRLIFVAFGETIFHLSVWAEFIFAGVVAWTGVKMMQGLGENKELKDYSNHWSVRTTRRWLPVFPKLVENKLIVSQNELQVKGEIDFLKRNRGKFFVTPLFLCLICIETADVLFAFDSVPAVIAVTREPFLVYTAMIFAILGLRSLYFLLAAATSYLSELDKAVALLLFFVAGKLCLQASNKAFAWPSYEIGSALSLVIIFSILGLGVVASLVKGKADTDK